MKAKDLIAILHQYDGDKEVIVAYFENSTTMLSDNLLDVRTADLQVYNYPNSNRNSTKALNNVLFLTEDMLAAASVEMPVI
jgi:hypothetical protein